MLAMLAEQAERDDEMANKLGTNGYMEITVMNCTPAITLFDDHTHLLCNPSDKFFMAEAFPIMGFCLGGPQAQAVLPSGKASSGAF